VETSGNTGQSLWIELWNRWGERCALLRTTRGASLPELLSFVVPVSNTTLPTRPVAVGACGHARVTAGSNLIHSGTNGRDGCAPTRTCEGQPVSATDVTRSAEFDAFGPWVDQVNTAAEVPGLYSDYPVDVAASRLVLKVPRNISRRDALPTMDLYDHLLIAGPAELVVLSRVNDSFTESVLGYGDIVAVTDTVDLVDGRLRILARTGETLAVPYNGSSQQVITRLADVLGTQSLVAAGPAPAVRLAAPDAPPAALDLLDLGTDDVGLVTSYFELMRHEPGATLLAAHGRTILTPRGGALTRAVHALYPMTLHGAVLCRSAHQLHILGRQEWLVRGSAPDLSRSHTTIPLAAIESLTVAQHSRYLGAVVVTVHSGSAGFEIVLPHPSAAERALEAQPAA
jgi:hypothetical protein